MQKSALSRKPQREAANEAELLAVIDKGGSSTARDETRAKPKDRAMNLRIPGHLATQMEEALNQRAVRISKNTWILEAIAEKAQRELRED